MGLLEAPFQRLVALGSIVSVPILTALISGLMRSGPVEAGIDWSFTNAGPTISDPDDPLSVKDPVNVVFYWQGRVDWVRNRLNEQPDFIPLRYWPQCGNGSKQWLLVDDIDHNGTTLYVWASGSQNSESDWSDGAGFSQARFAPPDDDCPNDGTDGFRNHLRTYGREIPSQHNGQVDNAAYYTKRAVHYEHQHYFIDSICPCSHHVHSWNLARDTLWDDIIWQNSWIDANGSAYKDIDNGGPYQGVQHDGSAATFRKDV